jgi:arginase
MTGATPAPDQTVTLIGVPMDLGGARRGTDMGPNAVRIAGIAEAVAQEGFRFCDLGNIAVADRSSLETGDHSARYLEPIVATCGELRSTVTKTLDNGELPLVVGGDHSIAVGTVAGVSDHFVQRDQTIGLLWFDAHGDLNTPDSSPSGNVHGMPLAACLGRGHQRLTELAQRLPMVEPKATAVVGVRSIDRREREVVEDLGVRVFTMREIDERGMHAVMTEALEIVSAGTAGYHVSFDVDGADPAVASGVGTPVPGGLTYRESHLFMEMVAEHGGATSLEITEINPILDTHNRTAEFAVGLCLSALGQQTL